MSKIPITMTSIIKASDEQVSRNLGGEAVILGLDQGMYFGTDEVGTLIWEALQQPVKVSSIRDQILVEYDVDQQQCEKDLLEFLEQLLTNRLIELVE